MWTLSNLIKHSNQTRTFIKGIGQVPARPINYKFRPIQQKIKEAWAVFTGKADCFTWDGDQ